MPARALAAALALVLVTGAHAGGGPANVLVLYNADSPDALGVAQYYQQARALPDGHLCGITGIAADTRTIDFADYWTLVHDPLALCLAALPQPEEIDYVAVVRGLPYRVDLPNNGYHTSLSAMVQVHEAADNQGGPLAGEPQYVGQYPQASIDNPVFHGGWCQVGDFVISNLYEGWYQSSCDIVRTYLQQPSFDRESAGASSGYDFDDNLFIVTRLDGFDFQDALDVVDRGVISDGTFPTAEILCMEGADEARGARDPECEFATRYLGYAGLPGVWLTPHDASLTGHTVAAYFTGAANIRSAIYGNTFVPGAITDNLTSYGAAPQNFFCDKTGQTCPESESQTSVARFIRAGATGTHGTVAEPLNNVFPNAGTLLYYTLGYNLGESYFFNQQFIYWVNLTIGDPLATPYAERPSVTIAPGANVPQGDDLVITASHPDGVAEVRLYIDGVHVADAAGDQLTWPVADPVGTPLQILAVAVAESVDVGRPGWVEPLQHPRPETQGWTTLDVVVDPPVQGDDDTADDDTGDDDTADDDTGDDDTGDDDTGDDDTGDDDTGDDDTGDDDTADDDTGDDDTGDDDTADDDTADDDTADDDTADDDTADDDTADDDTADDDTADDDTADDDTADDDTAGDDDDASGCECEGSEDALTAPAAPVPMGILLGASLWFRVRRRR